MTVYKVTSSISLEYDTEGSVTLIPSIVDWTNTYY